MKKYFKYLIVTTMFVASMVSCMKDNYLIVAFYSHEGEEVWEMLVKKDEKMFEPEIPMRVNYSFEGWYTDNYTFANKWNFDENIFTTNITLYAKWKFRENVVEFTESTTWIVPEGVTLVDVFCVGGGGSGAGDFIWANHSGSGGNGGVVTFTQNVSVTPGKSIKITVGTGGVGGKRFNGAPGGESSFGTMVVSAGGYGGNDSQPEKQVNHGDKIDIEGQPDKEENSGRGGRRGSVDENSDDLQGGDGIECPIHSTNGKYGAGGAGANTAFKRTSLLQNGGDTGGGNSGYGEDNTPQNRGSNATFYGGGGGGGAFSSNHTYSLGGNGHSGIIIINY